MMFDGPPDPQSQIPAVAIITAAAAALCSVIQMIFTARSKMRYADKDEQGRLRSDVERLKVEVASCEHDREAMSKENRSLLVENIELLRANREMALKAGNGKGR